MGVRILLFMVLLAGEASARPWATIWDSCQRYLVPQSTSSRIQAPKALEMLKDLRQRAALGRDLTGSEAIEELVVQVRKASAEERAKLLFEVQREYTWARVYNPTLRRIYNLVLKNTVPEARDFRARSRRVGATLAFEEYWRHMDEFFLEDGEMRFRLDHLKAIVKEVREVMRLHPGPYQEGPRLLLAGSTVNGQARVESDFDGWIFPVHFFAEARSSLGARSGANLLAHRLDRRIVERPYVQPKEFFEKNRMFGLVQPFALDITAKQVRLIYFYENPIRGLLTGDAQTFVEYELDWR